MKLITDTQIHSYLICYLNYHVYFDVSQPTYTVSSVASLEIIAKTNKELREYLPIKYRVVGHVVRCKRLLLTDSSLLHDSIFDLHRAKNG